MSGSWFDGQDVKRNTVIISQWTFQLFSVHNDLLHCKFGSNSCARHQLINQDAARTAPYQYTPFNESIYIICCFRFICNTAWPGVDRNYSSIFCNSACWWWHGIRRWAAFQIINIIGQMCWLEVWWVRCARWLWYVLLFNSITSPISVNSLILIAFISKFQTNYISDLRQKPYQPINNVETNYGTQSV